MILLSILFTFTSLTLDAIQQEVSQLSTYSELTSFIEKKIDDQNRYDNTVYIDILREIGHGYQQARLVFKTEEHGQYFHMSVVKHGNQLIYATLSQDKKERKIVFDEAGIDKYVAYFNNTFGTNKKASDFAKEIDSVWIFSSACGYSGEPTKEWKQMEKSVDNQKLNKVRSLLNTMDVEAQVYGFIGMTRLQQQGVQLTSQDLKSIAHLKAQNSLIYTCMGCFMGEIMTVKELTKSK